MRGKRFLGLFALFALIVVMADSSVAAQGLQVKRTQGENIIIAWDYLQADEASITAFKLKMSTAAISGPYTDVTGWTTIAVTVRTVTLPANFPTGISIYYLKPVAANGTNESPIDETNPVAIERRIKGAKNVSAQ